MPDIVLSLSRLLSRSIVNFWHFFSFGYIVLAIPNGLLFMSKRNEIKITMYCMLLYHQYDNCLLRLLLLKALGMLMILVPVPLPLALRYMYPLLLIFFGEFFYASHLLRWMIWRSESIIFPPLFYLIAAEKEQVRNFWKSCRLPKIKFRQNNTVFFSIFLVVWIILVTAEINLFVRRRCER